MDYNENFYKNSEKNKKPVNDVNNTSAERSDQSFYQNSASLGNDEFSSFPSRFSQSPATFPQAVPPKNNIPPRAHLDTSPIVKSQRAAAAPASRFSPSKKAVDAMLDAAPLASSAKCKTLGSRPHYAVQIPMDVKRCPRNFFSASHGAFPMSSSLYKASGMEFSLFVQCLPTYGPEIPVVDNGNSVVVRCKSCRAYLNPFVVFPTANTWQCNLCDEKNAMPPSCKGSLDDRGLRRDREERPELVSCYYDIIAPSEYLNRVPQVPIFFLVVDVSLAAVASGMLEILAESMRGILPQLAANPRAQLALITFDSALHFYQLRKDGSQTKIAVSADLDSVCPPPASDLLLNVAENIDALGALFENLVSFHAGTKTKEAALGSALVAAQTVLSTLGGKVALFAASPPSAGEGVLKDAFAEKPSAQKAGKASEQHQPALNTDEETERLLKDTSEFYTARAYELNNEHVSVDVFQFAQRESAVDSASLGALARYTGGRFFVYDCLSGPARCVAGSAAGRSGASLAEELEQNARQLGGDLWLSLLSPVAWESMMRVRMSRQLDSCETVGQFVVKNVDLLSYPVTHSGDSIALTVRFAANEEEDVVVFKNFVFFQAALLFTSPSGERKIRVFNLAVPVVANLREFVESVHLDNFCAYMAKFAADKSLKVSLRFARNLVQNASVSLLKKMAAFAKFNSKSIAEMPASLRYFALLTVGLLKTDALREVLAVPLPSAAKSPNELVGERVSPQRRYQSLHFVRTATLDELRLYCHPLAFSLVGLLCEEGFHERLEGLLCEASLPLNSLLLVSCPVLAVFDAQNLLVRVSLHCQETFLDALFGVRSLDGVDTLAFLPASSARGQGCDMLSRLHFLLEYLQRRAPSRSLQPRVLVEGERTDRLFESFLYEERTDTVMSIDEFLKYIVKTINAGY